MIDMAMLEESNSANIMQDFREYVDTNSQSNGQSADSTGPMHYLFPKFSTIRMPKNGVPNYEECLQSSVVGEFNRVCER